MKDKELKRQPGRQPQPNLMEELAKIQHDKWCAWAKDMRDNDTPKNNAKWKELSEKAYKDLPEGLKEINRAEVRKTLEVINSHDENFDIGFKKYTGLLIAVNDTIYKLGKDGGLDVVTGKPLSKEQISIRQGLSNNLADMLVSTSLVPRIETKQDEEG